ncbi:Glycosyltransferase involved in cell wall bisynthesis [Roseovarius litoreus]|uniref:Glycosyltransferase involved in cell wall bisynthesis n=1 Tax=Roseovarius litoreus TaxID=1155722 RepID=A0A1M7K9V1_9RHOB|nr:glycosyltransferase family 4 protein [Roseovarius litoreus]SHM62072.1 Glycosyltransferase involved in cell wall bisynthesis [Roseovarius litoreus]
MKITFVSPAPNLSGGIRVIAIYADLLTEMGHDVTVVARVPPRPGAKAVAKGLIKGRLPRKRGASHYDGLKARLHLVETDMPLTDKDIPDGDAVIATLWETAYMVAGLSDAKGRKFYFVQHHEVHSPNLSHFSAGSYYLPLKKIAVSGWLVSAMRDLYGDHDVSLVPNAVDPSLFFAASRDKRTRPTVSMMYSKTSFKGTDTSLKAVNLARQVLPDIHLLAFGSQRPSPDLPLPPDTTFYFSPPQTSLRDIYAASDLYLFGSRFEGFGLPVLEAMACRCPVVATRAGCAPDFILHGKSGYLVDVDDPESMAEAIVDVLCLDNCAWKAMSLAAFQAVEGYQWTDAAKRFLACLQPT